MSNYCPNCGYCLRAGQQGARTRWNYQLQQPQVWWPQQQQPQVVIQIQGYQGRRYFDRPRATIEEIPSRQNQYDLGPQQGGNFQHARYTYY